MVQFFSFESHKKNRGLKNESIVKHSIWFSENGIIIQNVLILIVVILSKYI